MSRDPQGAESILRTAELTNAPGSGFSQEALRTLAVIDTLDLSGRTTGRLLADLGELLCAIAAWETVLVRSVLRSPIGDEQAAVTASLNEAVGATARAFGALDDAHEALRAANRSKP